MVFKKKKPEIIDTTKEAGAWTGGDGVPMPPTPPPLTSPPPVVEDSVELKHLKVMSKAVHERYGAYFSVDDAANLPDAVWRSELVVLLAALLDEIRAMRQLIAKENE